MREEEPPEDLESRMRREHAAHAKVMEKALKPKTLNAPSELRKGKGGWKVAKSAIRTP